MLSISFSNISNNENISHKLIVDNWVIIELLTFFELHSMKSQNNDKVLKVSFFIPQASYPKF